MKMTFCTLTVVSYLVLSSLHAQTATPAPAPPTPRISAAEAQKRSLEHQLISIQQQVPQERVGEGFFQLSRPATMGATAAAPASAFPSTLGATFAPTTDCDPLPQDQVDALIDKASNQEKLDPDILRGIMRQESAFKPCAVSSKGAQGLMQLMPATALQFGVDNPFDPVQNVDGGAKLLKQLLSRYNGDLGKALGAYNAGPAKVDAVNGIPQIPETQDYVKQILSLLPVK